MDYPEIATRAELDAALAAQRDRYIERLRRQSRGHQPWIWVAVAWPYLCLLVAYVIEGDAPPAYLIASLGVSSAATLVAASKSRQLAARQLAKELEQ